MGTASSKVLVVSLSIGAFGSHVPDTSKRGAAYNDVAAVGLLSAGQTVRQGTVSWAYNWAIQEPGTLPHGVEYVPMLWGARSFEEDGWQASIRQSLSKGSRYILGFNEPDRPDQAALSPSMAADLYRQHITPFRDKATLISPAVTSSRADGEGVQWLDAFMQSCASCEITGMAVHWYGDSGEEFKSFIQDVMDRAQSYGLSEVWVTEFGLSDDEKGVKNEEAASRFIQDVIPWLDAQKCVTRYAYFMCAEGYLLSGGSPNGAGTAYTSATPTGGASTASPMSCSSTG